MIPRIDTGTTPTYSRGYDCIEALLRQAGLRPTRQRLSLVKLLFAQGPRHVSAEALYEEARRAGLLMSLATVYNALHQFTEAGLLRELAADGAKSYFDTNVAHHHHFLIDGHRLIDVAAESVAIAALPAIPEGMEIARIDVVIRLKPKQA
ncbi:MAG: Fur family transcriptional regulator [Ancalomicrobiaceae bacterium]|nr:Fur family transcriptional regulator [Ancalomicrobiaceae bacterium]